MRTIPQHVDSTGKLLNRLALVAIDPVMQKGKLIAPPPKKILVTPSLLREFRCVSGCTACCLPFTLDYTPEEFEDLDWTEEITKQAVDQFRLRTIEVDGRSYEVLSYPQYKDNSCPYLRQTRENGALGCGFWSKDNSTQPVECAAAPQLLMTTRGMGSTVIMKKPFGRAWSWKVKPQCEFDPVIDHIKKIPDNFDLSNEIMLLKRYLHWADYLDIPTWIPAIIEILEDFPNQLRLTNLRSVIIDCQP